MIAQLTGIVVEANFTGLGYQVVSFRNVGSVSHVVLLGNEGVIEEIREKFHPAKIYIEAQSYAVSFYAREGFRVTSEEFLEDGIPHVKMELVL